MFEIDTKFGAFGCVKILEDNYGRKFARKHLEPKESVLEAADLDRIKERFKREVRVQKQLLHDFFMPILDSNLNDDPPWFLMPCADETFETFIKENRGNPIAFETPLMDILNSLEELEKLDIKHRDLKPGNILKHEGRWKLTDFGLVSAGSEFSGPLSSAHSTWGSLPYCSPEQMLSFKHVSCSTDIYSFGCILHDIFVNEQRVPYRQHSGPDAIGLVIEKCTAEKPEKRFKSIAGLRSALALALRDRSSENLTSSVEQWVQDLADVNSWTEPKFSDFSRLLKRPLGKHEESELFLAFDPDSFELFYAHAELWTAFVEFYSSRTRGSFGFTFCDVIGSNLNKIYDLGSLSDKVCATMSAAQLGRSHNRYYVMKLVQRFAGPSIDDNLATRLVIEINAEDAARNFRECATHKEQESDNYTSYHLLINNAIRKGCEELF